jgi:hypothetical protein
MMQKKRKKAEIKAALTAFFFMGVLLNGIFISPATSRLPSDGRPARHVRSMIAGTATTTRSLPGIVGHLEEIDTRMKTLSCSIEWIE